MSIYLAAMAAAEALTFDFSRDWGHQVTGTSLGLSGKFTGSFSFDPGAQGSESAPTIYAGASLTIDFGMPAESVTIDPAFVGVSDDVVFGNFVSDAFTLSRFNQSGPLLSLADPLPGIGALSDFFEFAIRGVSVDLVDLDGDVFDDGSLPTAIDLDDFTSALLTIRDGSAVRFAFRIDRLEAADPAPIPLPASALLLLAGLGGLLSLRVGAAGRRR